MPVVKKKTTKKGTAKKTKSATKKTKTTKTKKKPIVDEFEYGAINSSDATDINIDTKAKENIAIVEYEDGTKRDSNGRFIKGNTIGEDTRFKFKHTFSRKYKDEYCDKMYEYFTDPINRPTVYPTFGGFALSIGVLPRTLYNWCEQYPQFAEVFDACKEMQVENLVDGGLRKVYDPTFSRFIASAMHGMREKTEHKVEGEHEVNINISVFDDE